MNAGRPRLSWSTVRGSVVRGSPTRSSANPNVDDFTKPDSQLAVVGFIYGANTWGNVATEVVKYYMMMHYNVLKRSYYLFDRRTPGYIMGWVYRTTNFYGNNSRD